MTGIASGILMTLGSNLLIQVSVVLIAGLVLESWAKRRGPAWACLAQRLTLLGVVAIPFAAIIGHTALPTTWYIALPEPTTFAASGTGLSPAGWVYAGVSVLWFVGAVLLWGRLLAGLWLSRRLLRRSEPATEDVTRRVHTLLNRTGQLRPDVRVSRDIHSPLLLGVRRPALILPADQVVNCDDAVLLHELTHLDRRDNAWLLLTQAVRATFWVHPLVWMLDVRRRQTAEFACDDAVVSATHNPQAYVRSLLHFAERSVPTLVPMPASSLFGSRRTLSGRVRRMLAGTPRADVRYSRSGLVLASLWIILGLVGSTLIAVHHTVGTAVAGYAWLWCAAS